MTPARTEEILDALTGTLEESGPDSDATRVYLALLRMDRPSRELLLAQGIPAAQLDPALAVLDARGLISLGSTGALEVPPPVTSLPHHAAELERRAQRVRAAAHELTQVYYNARTRERDPATGVHVLHDRDEVAARTNQVVAEARVGLRCLRAMTLRTHDVMGAPLASHREPSIGAHGQVLPVRTVWDVQTLELPGAVEVLAARAEGGEAQRFLARVPLSVVVADDSACVVEWSCTDDSGPQGVLLRIGGMVLGLRALVDRLWEAATSVSQGTGADELEARDVTILRLLAAGVPDVAIARQTGISQRTVERRIRWLMDRLGAQTRFQAGTQAVHRGWL